VLCKIVTGSGIPTAVAIAPGSSGASGVKCPTTIVRGAVPKGAPGTGGGGMATEVGSWR
jgi:hypothetical protein